MSQSFEVWIHCIVSHCLVAKNNKTNKTKNKLAVSKKQKYRLAVSQIQKLKISQIQNLKISQIQKIPQSGRIPNTKIKNTSDWQYHKYKNTSDWQYHLQSLVALLPFSSALASSQVNFFICINTTLYLYKYQLCICICVFYHLGLWIILNECWEAWLSFKSVCEVADCPAMSFIFVRNTNQLSWAINYMWSR